MTSDLVLIVILAVGLAGCSGAQDETTSYGASGAAGMGSQGSECNDITLSSRPVAITYFDTGVPEPAGGVFTDGTFDLVEVRVFAPDAGVAVNAPERATIRLEDRGAREQIVSLPMDQGGGTVLRATADLLMSDAITIQHSFTCPPALRGQVRQFKYTAQGSELVRFAEPAAATGPVIASVYARRQ